MKDVEEKLAMFRLDDQYLKGALRAIDLVKDGQKGPATYTVETVIVLDGEAKVVAKESLSV